MGYFLPQETILGPIIFTENPFSEDQRIEIYSVHKIYCGFRTENYYEKKSILETKLSFQDTEWSNEMYPGSFSLLFGIGSKIARTS